MPSKQALNNKSVPLTNKELLELRLYAVEKELELFAIANQMHSGEEGPWMPAALTLSDKIVKFLINGDSGDFLNG